MRYVFKTLLLGVTFTYVSELTARRAYAAVTRLRQGPLAGEKPEDRALLRGEKWLQHPRFLVWSIQALLAPRLNMNSNILS